MTVILIAGPSGSGKDTLMRTARNHFAGETQLLFARRYITRPPDTAEDNYYLSMESFEVLERAGYFIAAWRAHGHRYGIAGSACCGCGDGRGVVVSVSRAAVADFESRLSGVTTILVEARPEVLAERLRGRGRENDAQIAARLVRSSAPVRARNLIRFDNSADLSVTRPAFIGLLERLVSWGAEVS